MSESQILTLSLLWFLTLFCGILRFTIPVKGEIVRADIYKDLAHLLVGFLFGYACYAGDRLDLWILPIGLIITEVVAFVIRKKPQERCEPNLPG